jgi:ComF family protein
MSVYSKLKHIRGWLLPAVCPLCGCAVSPERDLCTDCEGSLPTLTDCCCRCAAPLHRVDVADQICGRCQQDPPAYATVHVPFHYLTPVDRLILGAKYAGRLDWAALLGRQLLRHAQARKLSFDVIVPVPLHRSRLRERGYNQSLELARPLMRQLKIPLVHAVRRVRATPAQTSLSGEERIKNVRGAFTVHGEVNGLSIAVVDDVVTSGATADAVARCLLRAGAKRVEILAVARA